MPATGSRRRSTSTRTTSTGPGRGPETRTEPGGLFIKFVALILRIHIKNAIRDHEQEILSSKRKNDNVCGMTVDSMMRSLSTLMLIHSPGYDRLTPVSKTVREIFALFGLEEPKSGRISRS